MFNLFQKIASLKFTLVGMVLLGLGASMSYDNPMDTSIWVLVIPLALLAINLSAAIATNSRINQQPGLLVFHICLLTIVILVGVGRLTHLDAHIELPMGTEFSPDQLMDVNNGPLHSGLLDQVHFIQGPYTVQYSEGLRRGLTHSYVKVLDDNGQWQEHVVGDDRPLVIKKYRFYTTYNKGFTTLLTWIPDNGEPQTGTVNMPSYPLFNYKQDNRWTPPGDKEIKFWLQLNTGLTEDEPWVLDGRKASGVLVVTSETGRQEIKVGETVKLTGGQLRFDALSTWMGYRVFYDPTIQWLFYVSIFGVLGLSYYFWIKMNLQPWERQSEDEKVIASVEPSPSAMASDRGELEANASEPATTNDEADKLNTTNNALRNPL